MANIDIKKAETCFPDLIRQTLNGNEIIITKDGQPLVKIISIREKQKKNVSLEAQRA